MPRKGYSKICNLTEKCKEIYGDLYDLSRIESDGYDNKYNILIGCKKHGWQKVNMYKFQNGCGCPECKKEGHHFKYTTETYCEACRKVHGNKYILDKIVFNGIKENITVICPKHGSFTISADKFLRGHGCIKCGNDKLSRLHQKTQDQYIEDCKKVHGSKYIIDETIGYIDTKHDVTPICPIHGPFTLNASSFLSGTGCKECAIETRREQMKMSSQEFIERSKSCHEEEYLYDRIDLNNFNYEEPQWIGCKKHKYYFQQMPEVHLRGCGCPKCGAKKSEGEETIYKLMVEQCGQENVFRHDRIILRGKEIDIYLPDYKLGIEFDGIRYHSEKCNKDKYYHLNKTLEAKKQGIKLIHIFEDEWIEHKDLVADKLLHFLHKTKKPIIGARKCNIKEVGFKDVKDFLNKYHLQGAAKASVYLAGYYNNEVISVMAFIQNGDEWELNRFCCNINYSFPGLASKMFKRFIDTHSPKIVKSFLDLRWNWPEDSVYNKLGFKLEDILRPDYSYVKDRKRYHKFSFRKQILHKKYNLPLTMTEKEMTEKLNCYRIWNCGLAKFVWKRSEDL